MLKRWGGLNLLAGKRHDSVFQLRELGGLRSKHLSSDEELVMDALDLDQQTLALTAIAHVSEPRAGQ